MTISNLLGIDKTEKLVEKLNKITKCDPILSGCP